MKKYLLLIFATLFIFSNSCTKEAIPTPQETGTNIETPLTKSTTGTCGGCWIGKMQSGTCSSCGWHPGAGWLIHGPGGGYQPPKYCELCGKSDQPPYSMTQMDCIHCSYRFCLRHWALEWEGVCGSCGGDT